MRWIRFNRRVYAATTGAVLALALSACGGGSPAASSQSVDKPQTEQQLVSAANKEGQLVWYTTFTDKQVPKMIAAFNKKYPQIKVNAVKLSSEMVPRITTEQQAGKYDIDVVSDSADELAALYAEDALVKYDAPNAPQVPGVKLPSGYRNVTYVKSTVIAWNPAALAKAGLQPPKTWEDLTKPEWKGKFSIVANSSALDFYLALISWLGHDKALDLVKRLGANSPVLATSHTEATTAVQSGEPIATATAYNYLTAQLKEENPNTMGFVDTKPLLTTINPVALVKNAPHPNAGKLFIDWLMSGQGQNVIVNATGHAAVSPTAKNDPAVWNPSKYPPVFAQSDLSGDQYNKLIGEYEAALGYKK